jgi:hypothetical protein
MVDIASIGIAVDQDLPSHMNYTGGKRIPLPGQKQIRYTKPSNSSSGPWMNNNNTITFQLSSKGFLDPWSLYIILRVVNTNSRIPLQLDNSAHSLISKVKITGPNGNVLEEIDNYDVIMSNINDMVKNSHDREACGEREGYGWGYDKKSNYKTTKPTNECNSEPILQPRSLNSKDLYTMSQDRFSRGLNTMNKPLIAFYEMRNGAESTDTLELDSRTFYIPLWSFIIGWGLTIYKYIPLILFGSLEIQIVLNPDAFFVPLPPCGMWNEDTTIQVTGDNLRQTLVNTGDIIEFQKDFNLDANGQKMTDNPKVMRYNTMEGENIGVYDANLVNKIGKINNPFRRNWQVIEATMSNEEMFFNDEVHLRILTLSNFTILTHQYKLTKYLQFKSKDMPTSISLTDVRGSVRYMHFIFLCASYLKSCFQRKLFKYSQLVKKYWLQLGNITLPNNQVEGNAGNTIGKDNNTAFFTALKKCAYGTDFTKTMAINPYNFALNYSPLDLINSNVLCCGNFSGYNEPIGRSIYAIDFERYPQTKGYWSGINMRGTLPCDLYITRNDEENALKHSELTDSQFIVYIFLYTDYRLSYDFNSNKWVVED